uniref:uncharacterized protein LOC129131816 n=1 Tax=Agelaius phoeniceus TaxID=39638 RepID=UPI0023ED3A15|nr:uncharacterized protein LOC129131816 [Agelaius phoeniceus]
MVFKTESAWLLTELTMEVEYVNVSLGWKRWDCGSSGPRSAAPAELGHSPSSEKPPVLLRLKRKRPGQRSDPAAAAGLAPSPSPARTRRRCGWRPPLSPRPGPGRRGALGSALAAAGTEPRHRALAPWRRRAEGDTGRALGAIAPSPEAPLEPGPGLPPTSSKALLGSGWCSALGPALVLAPSGSLPVKRSPPEARRLLKHPTSSP